MELDSITGQLEDIIPQNALDVVEDVQLDNISFGDIYHDVLDSILSEVLIPKELLVSLVGVVLISALMQSFSEVSKVKKPFEMVCVLVCVKVVVSPLSEILNSIQEMILNNGAFMNSFTPIFTTVMLATGQVSTSATYGTFTYLACQMWVQFADKLILPLMSLCLGLCCVNGLCSEVSLSEVVKLIKKCVNWMMTVTMFIFSGVLSLQSTITNLSDRVSAKALKFMVSNGVPIVGNAVSDVCETVRSSMQLIKSGVGFLGIMVLMVNVLPPILNVALIRVVISLAETLADTFGVSSVKSFLTDVSAILSIVFSCAVCFVITFVISIGAMMLLVNV
jgi:stage III sporulation protein AE